jgi:hypothetical protein
VTSLYLCADAYCSTEDRDGGLGGQNRSCQNQLPPFDIVANYTGPERARLRRLQREEAAAETLLKEVVLVSERLFVLARDTTVQYHLPAILA